MNLSVGEIAFDAGGFVRVGTTKESLREQHVTSHRVHESLFVEIVGVAFQTSHESRVIDIGDEQVSTLTNIIEQVAFLRRVYHRSGIARRVTRVVETTTTMTHAIAEELLSTMAPTRKNFIENVRHRLIGF